MKHIYTVVILAVAAAFCQPSVASKTSELNEACKANPSHAICQEREAKKERAKARREAKMDAAIQRVKENK